MKSLGSGNKILEVEDLTIGYNRGPILSDLSFSVPEGAFIAIFGQNGSGKSTLLKAIAGLLPLQAGKIFLSGQSIGHLQSWHRVACGVHILLQSERVFPEFDVYTNVEMGGYAIRDKSERNRRVREVLSSNGMFEGRYREPSSNLSGGEQQVLALLRTLVMEPKLLLLDEPSTGLAPAMRDRVSRLLADLNAKGITIVMVEQNVPFAKALTNDTRQITISEMIKLS